MSDFERERTPDIYQTFDDGSGIEFDSEYSDETSAMKSNDIEFINDIKKDIRWDATHIIKVTFGAGIGSFLEFYGFGLVGYFENEISLSFFPINGNDYYQFLEAFTVFGIAFIMRPIGGLLFGYIGDKYGRVYSLKLSLIGLSIFTFLFGCIPNYDSIGVIATVLCFVFRMMQGICVGGEMSTAIVYIVEMAPINKKGLLIGILYSLSCGGYLALISYAIYSNIFSKYNTQTQIEKYSWMWRVPFILCVFIGVFGLYIRSLLPSSFEFNQVTTQRATLSNPIRYIFTNNKRELFILFLTYIAGGVLYYGCIVWIPAYLDSGLHISIDYSAYDMDLIQAPINLFIFILTGYLIDKYGSYSISIKSGVLSIIVIFITFTLFGIVSNIAILSVLQLSLCLTQFFGCSSIMWSILWVPDARLRNTITGIAYNLGNAIFVSTELDLLTTLSNKNEKYGPMYSGMYLILLILCSLLGIIYGQKYPWNINDLHFYGIIPNERNNDINIKKEIDIIHDETVY